MPEKAALPPVAERVKVAREALDISQAELAIRVGMTQTGVGAIEAGKSIRPKRLRELAAALNTSEAWLLGETHDASLTNQGAIIPNPNPNAGAAVAVSLPRGRVPVLGLATGGPDGRMSMPKARVTDTFCPPSLEGVEGAYAVYVHGTSMEDRFRAGDTVWAHPYQPPREGDDVIIQIAGDSRTDLPAGYVKRFIRFTGKELVVKQLNPADGENELLRFATEKVLSVHKVVFVAPA